MSGWETQSGRMMQFRQGFIACVPTLLGYWAIGFACGAIGKVSGFSIVEIVLLSVFLYAGSAHFLFYSLAATGVSIAQVAFAIAFVNMRYLLINTYMAQFFKHSSLKEKLIGGLLTTDETFGVATRYANHHEGKLPFYWLLGLNLTAWVNWIISTAVGFFFAAALPNWMRNSLSFSLVGMFVGLLLLSWFVSHTRILDIIVMTIAMLFIIFTHNTINSNIAMIIATLIAATVGMILLMRKSKEEQSR
ncbi:MAG: Azaleucine resistance protein AzlC [Candidatus Tokpelaia sp. JSC188]|nr:MAG: Azaleucine resistance protein AzlC [Candidatus Tokpelaia sp. JSC188]